MTTATKAVARREQPNENQTQLIREGFGLLRETIICAGGLIGRAMESSAAAMYVAGAAIDSNRHVSAAAIDSNRQTSLAAIESGRQHGHRIADIATTALEISHKEHQQQMKLSEEQRREAEKALLLEMRINCAAFQAIIDNPLQATLIAQQNVARLDLVLGKKTTDSRTARIDLARRSIEQAVASSQNQQMKTIALLFYAAAVPFVSLYFGDARITSSLTVVGLLVLYKGYSRLKALDLKIQWMRVYIAALGRLKSDGALTVHAAVNQALAAEPIMNAALYAPRLGAIPDSPVQGDPTEETPLIPNELQPLVTHAQQSFSVFI